MNRIETPSMRLGGPKPDMNISIRFIVLQRLGMGDSPIRKGKQQD
jgi:hypothetical protein